MTTLAPRRPQRLGAQSGKPLKRWGAVERGCRWAPSALITKTLLLRPPFVPRSKAIFLPLVVTTSTGTNGGEACGAEAVEVGPVGSHDLDPSALTTP